MPLPRSKRQRAINLFKPNELGESQWVSVSEFEEAGLNWSNNGNLRRGVAFGLKDILWDVERLGAPRSTVVALRMAGWNDIAAFDQSINSAVRSYFEEVNHCNISLLPVPDEDREIDHRFGNKDHPDYVDLYRPENQTPETFQLIHRVLNLQKRQMCVTCTETGVRPAHPDLGYAEGNQNHAARFPCRGCYLAEPERFRKK